MPIEGEIASFICDETSKVPFEFKCTNSIGNKTTIYNITFNISDKESYNKAQFRFKNNNTFTTKSKDEKIKNSSERASSMSSSKKQSSNSFKISRSYTNLKQLFEEGKIDSDFYSRRLNDLIDARKISDKEYSDAVLLTAASST